MLFRSRAFDGDQRYTKGATELSLRRAGGDVELRCDVTKGGAVILIVTEHGHAGVKVRHRYLGSGET